MLLPLKSSGLILRMFFQGRKQDGVAIGTVLFTIGSNKGRMNQKHPFSTSHQLGAAPVGRVSHG